MNRSVVGFITVVAVSVGWSLGNEANVDAKIVTETETKIVEVPTVRTKTVYVDKAAVLPENCYEAIEQLPRMIEGDKIQTAAVGTILLALQDAGTAAAFNDIHEINRLVEIVRAEGGKLDASVIDRQRAVITFESYLGKCEADIEALS